jgi:Photosynthesis system II assembly factor YCF48
MAEWIRLLTAIPGCARLVPPMDETGLSGRAQRALALMGVAAVALAVAAGVYLHATARPAPPPPRTTVTSLDWLSPRVGWIVVLDAQQRSVLYHTTDGGEHWSRQFATVASGVSVRFLDVTRGLMTEPTPYPSPNPTLLRTGDGGEHWTPIPLAPEVGPNPNLPFFLDLQHGWVMMRTGRSDTSEDAQVFRTADGGLDWTLAVNVDPISLVSHGLREQGLKRWLWFRTLDDGLMGALQPDGSVAVYVTHNGGVDWRLVPLAAPAAGWPAGDTLTLLPPTISEDGEGTMLVVDTSRASGRPPRVGRAVNFALPAVLAYRTQDGGDTWGAPMPAPNDVDVNLADPTFVAGGAFVTGTDGWLAAGGSTWLTADSGRTWTRGGRLPAGQSFLQLAPVDGSVAVGEAAASPGPGAPWSLFLTDDAGRTWREVPAPPA